MPRGFAHEDHTADLLIHAWGATLEEAVAEAARGLVGYMVELPDGAAPLSREIEVAAEDRALLVYRFLEEVRFALEVDGLVLREFEVRLEAGRLRARARGDAYDPERHGHVHEIKAVTLHGAEIRESPAEIRILVDI